MKASSDVTWMTAATTGPRRPKALSPTPIPSTTSVPKKFVMMIRRQRRATWTASANFVGTLVVDGIGVGLSAFGLLGPVVAAVIHVTSELAFILNSARLLPRA